MPSSDSNSAVVLELAEEFLERFRKGERPSLKEYFDRYPNLAAQIKEVFPAMAMMENIALGDDSMSGAAEPVPPLAPMLQKLGDYRIIREVGRGGMGVVYEAEQVSLGRHVALKVLPNNALVEPRNKRRFEREAKAAAKLHHTNIVPVFGVGEDDGMPYYIMQFIQGLGLNEVMVELKRIQGNDAPGAMTGELPVSRRDMSAVNAARSLLTGQFDGEGADDVAPALASMRQATAGGFKSADPPTIADPGKPDIRPPTPDSGLRASSDPLSGSSVKLPGQSGVAARSKKRSYWHSVAHVGAQVASALDYAHHQGILHRDIKPSNLLLDTQGTVWVTDFGLAKTDDQQNLTTTGDILGTLRYMPPEAFEGKADRRGDVYSLGITLYEMLAMRPAYGEKDRHRLIKQVTTSEPDRLESLNPAIPRDLVTIVHKSIDRDAAHRYSTAEELAADLHRFLEDEPIHARRLSTFERCGRWCRRNPLVAGLTAAVILVTAIGFAATYNRMQAAQENELRANLSAAEADQERRKTMAAYGELEKSEANVKSALSKAIDLTNALNASEYNRNVKAMQDAWDTGNLSMAREYLDQLRPKHDGQADLRGFEWHLFDRLCNSDVKRIALEQPITTPDAVLTADGSRLFSGRPETLVAFDDGINLGGVTAGIRLWVTAVDTATGKTLRSIILDPPTPKAKGGNEGFADGLVPISTQKQGDKKAGKGKGGLVDPGPIGPLVGGAGGGGGKGTSVAPIWTVNRNGTKLAYVAGGSGSGKGGGGGSIPGGFPIFDLLSEDGKTFDVTSPALNAMRAPLEKWAKDNKITTGVVTREQFAKFLETLSVAQKGGAVSGKDVAPWNLNPFGLLNTDFYPAGVPKLAPSFNQKYAAGAAAWVSLFAIPQGAGPLLGASRAFAGQVGDYLDPRQLTGSAKGSPAHLRVVDVTTGTPGTPIPLGDIVRNQNEVMAISPDGALVAWHQGPGSTPLQIWKISGGKKTKQVVIDHQALYSSAKTPIAPGLRLVFSPDGTRLAATYKFLNQLTGLAVWDTSTGKLILWCDLNGPASPPAFSADGKQLAVLCMPALNQGATRVAPWAIDAVPAMPYIAHFDAITGEQWDDIPTGNMSVGVDYSQNTGPQLRYSRDGKLIAAFNQPVNFGLGGGVSIPSSTTISIFNTDTLELTRTLRGHQAAIVDVTAAASDQGFVSASMDGWIKEWDASGYDLLQPIAIAGFEQFSSVKFNSQNMKFALWNGALTQGLKGPKLTPTTTIGVMDFKGQKFPTYTEHKGGIVEVALSPGGEIAASVGFLDKASDKGELHVWDMSTAKGLFVKPVPTYAPNSSNLATRSILARLAFSANGKRLAVAARTGIQGLALRYQLRVIDAKTGVPTCKPFEVEGSITELKFSPDGLSLVGTVTGKGLMVWNADTGELRWKLERAGNDVGAVGFNADGTRLVAADVLSKGGKKFPENGGEVLVFDFPSGQKVLTTATAGFGFSSPILALSPDGKWLAVRSAQAGKGAAGTDIDIYDVDRNIKVEPPLRGNQFVEQIAFSPDGRRLLIRDGNVVKVWDFTTRQSLLTLKVPGGDALIPLDNFYFTPDGHRLVLRTRYGLGGGRYVGTQNASAFSVLDATPLPERK